MSREYSWSGSSWTLLNEKRRVYDGMDVIQERDQNNNITAKYTRDGNIGGILAKRDFIGTDTNYTFHYDGSGNVTQLTKGDASLQAEYSYDAYGITTNATGAYSGGNLYRYSTKELEPTSGLYDYGFRFYNPGLGRWINRDPIQESGGLNLYGFVTNDPMNYADVDGLKKVAHIFITPFKGDDMNERIMKSYIQSEIDWAKEQFSGYDQVFVHKDAAGSDFERALKRKDTSAIFVYGHGTPGGKILTNGNSVSAADVKSWLGGRKLENAIFHICFVGTDAMKEATVGEDGYFWGTTNFYSPITGTGLPPLATHLDPRTSKNGVKGKKNKKKSKKAAKKSQNEQGQGG